MMRFRPQLEQCEERVLLAAGIPQPAHVVIAVEENHSFNEILGSTSPAAYIKSLAADPSAAVFSQSFAVEHPSQPNYLDLFSGSNQGVTDDNVPSNLPFTTANLGASLINKGLTFTGYAEDLPAVGSNVAASGSYARKHNPWVNWQNAGVNGIPAADNQPFTSFPTDFSTLPTLSFVVPNQTDDMHDGTDPTTIVTGDAWLRTHLDGYIQWAKTHNSLFVLTFDEDDSSQNNQITTLFLGPMVKGGTYSETINHFNVLRTLEDMFNLPHAGNSATATPITDIWTALAPTPSVFAVGAGPGGNALVNVYDAGSGTFLYAFQAFETGFTGGVRVAVARDSAGNNIIAAAAGPGGFLVRTFLARSTGASQIGQFMPFGGFAGGIWVALGDLNGDGTPEVVCAPDAAPNSDPFLNVWNLNGTVQLSPNVAVFEQGFHGGVRVAVGDLDGDGRNEIVGTAGPGGLALVQVINGQTFQREARFDAFDVGGNRGFTGGVTVTTALLDGSGQRRLVIGADGADGNLGDEPVLRAFDGRGNLVRDLVAVLEPSYHGGVVVGSVRGFGRSFDSILAGPARPHAPTLTVLDQAFNLSASLAVQSGDASFNNGITVG
jgi:hypothetical protein